MTHTRRTLKNRHNPHIDIPSRAAGTPRPVLWTRVLREIRAGLILDIMTKVKVLTSMPPYLFSRAKQIRDRDDMKGQRRRGESIMILSRCPARAGAVNIRVGRPVTPRGGQVLPIRGASSNRRTLSLYVLMAA